MAQNDIGTIDPTTTSGTQLATLLSNWALAIESSNAGTARPTYVKAGMLWVNTSNANLHVLNYYDGVNDAPLIGINPNSHTLTQVAGATYPPVQSTTGLVPTTETISTPMTVQGGGDLSAPRTLTLKGDLAAPGNSMYYGTNASGVPGWYASSTGPTLPSIQYALWATAGSYTWTCPAGVNVIFLTIWGGGGAGISPNPGYPGAGLAGRLGVTPGTVYNLTVGAGGTAGASGSASNFASGYIVAGGGGGAAPSSGSVIPGGVDMAPFAPALFLANGTFAGEGGLQGLNGSTSGLPGCVVLEYIA